MKLLHENESVVVVVGGEHNSVDVAVDLMYNIADDAREHDTC